MRIGVVGGLDRATELLARRAAQAGHVALFHTGDVGGRGSRTLSAMIERCDVVLVITEINSHGALQLTRRLLRERNREPVLMRRCGVGQFTAFLETLS